MITRLDKLTSLLRLLVAAASATLVCAAPASATSVAVDGTTIYVLGTAGETNGIIVSEDPDGISVRDSFSSVITGPPCSNRDDRTAVCPYQADRYKLYVFGGDGNDELALVAKDDGRFSTEQPVLGGDEGNDVIRILAGPGAQLQGNEGDDRLFGGSGADLLVDGPGNDEIDASGGDDGVLLDPGSSVPHQPATDRDVVSGGSERDRLLFRAISGVTVNLDGVANDGVPGESDNIANDFEIIQGTEGPDTITAVGRAPRQGIDIFGLGGNDVITGASGNDSIFGGDGDDRIDPGTGRDQVKADAGNDTVVSRDAPRGATEDKDTLFTDAVSCGDGTDRLEPDALDFAAIAPFNRDCETIERPADLPLVTVGGSKRGLTLKRGTVTLRSAFCAENARVNCRGTIHLRLGGLEVASGRFNLEPGSTKPVKLKLRAAGKKQLERRRSLKVKATAVTPGRTEKLGTYRLKP
jgi:hypothetical protein